MNTWAGKAGEPVATDDCWDQTCDGLLAIGNLPTNQFSSSF